MPRSPRLSSLALLSLCAAAAAPVVPPDAAKVVAEADRVADAQLPVLETKGSRDWVWAVFDAGLADYAQVVPAGDRYRQTLTALADKAGWTPGTRKGNPFHADDFCIGQAWLDLYADHPDPARLAPLKARADGLVDHLKDEKKLTWWWCDALFMAPPVLARMSAVTGDRKYLDAMDGEYWQVAAALYDPADHLFYRDARFVGKPDKAGKKVFWARGNGWVAGGLVRVLQSMGADYPSRPKYVAVFKDMMARLAPLQDADGTWHSSLLDPDAFRSPETSGTAFYVYAMAWGINHGLLDAAAYRPHVTKGWDALLADRRPDGLPGYVQGVGDKPGPSVADGTQPYASGAMLMAAIEVRQLAEADPAHAAMAGGDHPIYLAAAAAAPVADPPPGTVAYARFIPERMDDLAWENDRIAHRIYGPALQHNPKEHSGSGIDVWVKKVRQPVVNEWYRSGKYHKDRGTGLDFYEVGHSRGDGGLGVWDDGKLYCSKDFTDYKILDLGKDACGFTLAYAPWDANGRSVWEHRTDTLKAGSNMDRIESTLDSDKPGEIIVGIGLAKRDGAGGHVLRDKDRGILAYWQPPEKSGTIGVGVIVDPASIVRFDEDKLNYLVLVRATAGKPFVYHAGACWDRGLDFHTADQWEQYLRDFKRD